MARPRSEDKQYAILGAATRVVAEQGVSAPTARIAREAGVAEGTLFTYFENKDVLLNALYLHLKGQMRAALMDGFPSEASAEERAQHAWNGYLAWGVANPAGRSALRQLGVSERIDARHRAAGSEGFGDMHVLLREMAAGSALPADVALGFAGSLLSSMAETTIEFIARHPAHAAICRDAGFRALWGALKA